MILKSFHIWLLVTSLLVSSIYNQKVDTSDLDEEQDETSGNSQSADNTYDYYDESKSGTGKSMPEIKKLDTSTRGQAKGNAEADSATTLIVPQKPKAVQQSENKETNAGEEYYDAYDQDEKVEEIEKDEKDDIYSKDDEKEPDSHEYIDSDDQMKNAVDKNGKVESETVAPTQPMFTQKSARSKLLGIMKKPGILAGLVGGAIIGVLAAILLVMFIVYRMKKKDEGSFALEETKKPLNAYDYRHCPTKEFYA